MKESIDRSWAEWGRKRDRFNRTGKTTKESVKSRVLEKAKLGKSHFSGKHYEM